jgi:hypothetical protein
MHGGFLRRPCVASCGGGGLLRQWREWRWRQPKWGWRLSENGKGEGFLNQLMFVGCHVTDEHKWYVPHVPCSLMFVSSTTSPTNISGQCHVRCWPIICSSVTCQTDERKWCSSILKPMNITWIMFISPDKFIITDVCKAVSYSDGWLIIRELWLERSCSVRSQVWCFSCSICYGWKGFCYWNLWMNMQIYTTINSNKIHL